MHPAAKGDMVAPSATEAEGVRVIECFRVAVGADQGEYDRCAMPDRAAENFAILRHIPRGDGNGRTEAQEFFGRDGREGWV